MKTRIQILLSVGLLLAAAALYAQDEGMPAILPYDSCEVVMLDNHRVFYYKNELFTGVVVQNLQISNVELEYQVENGVIDRLLGYYPNGTLEREYNYQNGIENGRFILYHPNGNLKQEQEFENGSLHGPQFKYGLNGETLEHNHYNKGQRVDPNTGQP